MIRFLTHAGRKVIYREVEMIRRVRGIMVLRRLVDIFKVREAMARKVREAIHKVRQAAARKVRQATDHKVRRATAHEAREITAHRAREAMAHKVRGAMPKARQAMVHKAQEIIAHRGQEAMARMVQGAMPKARQAMVHRAQVAREAMHRAARAATIHRGRVWALRGSLTMAVHIRSVSPVNLAPICSSGFLGFSKKIPQQYLSR